MITTQTKRLCAVLGAAAVALAIAVGTTTAAQRGGANATPVSHDAIGSWFGRAVPVPGQTICDPGPGCPVPPEIVMIFTVGGDGTFIGIDSNIFAGGNHSTAHGQWKRSGPRSIRAEFTLLQSSPTGTFIGGFKNLFDATVVSRDEMRGSIDARLYTYTDATGAAIVDADGFPTPSPLAPASGCSTTAGCTHLGTFSFLVRRVKVQ
ncbi:MAG TPA: hypothetical protein VK886_20390 [Vicinamibacterales bacterium]|nr:hypothetical protein [Vicinamibacterales bacterium]